MNFRMIAVVYLLLTTAVFAVEGPSVIRFKAGVVFNHDTHRNDRVSGACYGCHDDGKVGKIDGWGKDWAHGTCLGCHDLYNEGPTTCVGCHDRGKS